MQTTLPLAVTDYLAGHNVMTLATQGSEGPWAAALWSSAMPSGLTLLIGQRSSWMRTLSCPNETELA